LGEGTKIIEGKTLSLKPENILSEKRKLKKKYIRKGSGRQKKRLNSV